MLRVCSLFSISLCCGDVVDFSGEAYAERYDCLVLAVGAVGDARALAGLVERVADGEPSLGLACFRVEEPITWELVDCEVGGDD